MLESKLTAVGFGFLIPFFFVSSGMNFDVDALGDPATLLKVPMFVALFLIVRGTPALLLYRGVLAARDRVALAFFLATELPLVVAITTIAVDQGHMRTSTAAALVARRSSPRRRSRSSGWRCAAAPPTSAGRRARCARGAA